MENQTVSSEKTSRLTDGWNTQARSAEVQNQKSADSVQHAETADSAESGKENVYRLKDWAGRP